MTTINPFAADSVYAQPGLTWMVRQYDRNPGKGETILSVTSTPSVKAVEAENDSLAAAQATGVSNPSTTRAELTNHHDAYRNFFDSTSIKRDYTG